MRHHSSFVWHYRWGCLKQNFKIDSFHYNYTQTLNAGFGSVLNEDGEVEMDAALMDGQNLELGGVTAVGKNTFGIQDY